MRPLSQTTSPGNHQAWVAVPGVTNAEVAKDFARRIRKGAGADIAASGATRVAGTTPSRAGTSPASVAKPDALREGHGLRVPLVEGLRESAIVSGVFVADHLRNAAKGVGVQIPDGHRFGLHSLRHSLASFLVVTAKTDPKTAQQFLRHAKVQTTLQLYTQANGTETRAAQGAWLKALSTRSGVA